jgi:hypothetical protein
MELVEGKPIDEYCDEGKQWRFTPVQDWQRAKNVGIFRNEDALTG